VAPRRPRAVRESLSSSLSVGAQRQRPSPQDGPRRRLADRANCRPWPSWARLWSAVSRRRSSRTTRPEMHRAAYRIGHGFLFVRNR
jgi:hypothetical protein